MDTKITKLGPEEMGQIGLYTPESGYGFVIYDNHLK